MGPCELLQLAYIASSALVFFGYSLKAFYIYMGGGEKALEQAVLSRQLWVPDGTFWLMGISSVIVLAATVALLECLIDSFFALIFRFLRCIFCPCCMPPQEDETGEEDEYDPEMGEWKKKRRQLPKLTPLGGESEELIELPTRGRTRRRRDDPEEVPLDTPRFLYYA